MKNKLSNQSVKEIPGINKANYNSREKKFKTPISTENGLNYNQTWQTRKLVAIGLSELPEDRWPFKHKGETDEEFKKRIEKLKRG